MNKLAVWGMGFFVGIQSANVTAMLLVPTLWPGSIPLGIAVLAVGGVLSAVTVGRA